jgi:hypothetical protein
VHYRRICDLCSGESDPRTFWAQPSIQYVHNLQTRQPDEFSDLTCLTGDVMHEDKCIRHATESNHTLLLMTAWVYKAELAYFLGMYSLAGRVDT